MVKKLWLGAALLIVLSVALFNHVNSNSIRNRAYGLTLKLLLQHDVPEISVHESVSGDYLYLDARSSGEYEVSHIQSASWVGYEDFDQEFLNDIPKDSPIVVYCSVGYRSEKITKKLLEEGFSNVNNLYGGIFEWVNQGHPVYADNRPTDTVHAYNKSWGIWLNKGVKVY